MFFVRTATSKDIAKIGELLRMSWHGAYDGRFGAEEVERVHKERHSPSVLSEYLAAPHSEFLVADDGRQLGGVAYAAMADGMVKTAVLYMLYVHPDEQRQGIGADLFAELETCFPAADVMRLQVDQASEGAVAFYRAHGFEEVGRINRSGDGEPGLPALVMEKRLPQH